MIAGDKVRLTERAIAAIKIGTSYPMITNTTISGYVADVKDNHVAVEFEYPCVGRVGYQRMHVIDFALRFIVPSISEEEIKSRLGVEGYKK